jgi:hypothetical protein
MLRLMPWQDPFDFTVPLIQDAFEDTCSQVLSLGREVEAVNPSMGLKSCSHRFRFGKDRLAVDRITDVLYTGPLNRKRVEGKIKERNGGHLPSLPHR